VDDFAIFFYHQVECLADTERFSLNKILSATFLLLCKLSKSLYMLEADLKDKKYSTSLFLYSNI